MKSSKEPQRHISLPKSWALLEVAHHCFRGSDAPSVPQRRAGGSPCPDSPREPQWAEPEHGVPGISLPQLATLYY